MERNLHDGAQQRLVGIALLLRLAVAALDKDLAGARRALERSSEELDLALGELRELARGLHPAIRTNHGLGVALQSLAGRAPVPVEISGAPRRRLPEAVEVAAYFVVAEALTNVAKYAGASRARVRVDVQDDDAIIEISDDGVGGAEPGAGTGLRGLADRVEVLGGRLELHSPPGDGMRIRAVLPCGAQPDEPARERHSATGRRSDQVFASVKAPVVERADTDVTALRVVVAEDPALLRAGVIRVLEDAGFESWGRQATLRSWCARSVGTSRTWR